MRARQPVAEVGDGGRTDVQRHPARRHLVHCHDAVFGVGREVGDHAQVHRQLDDAGALLHERSGRLQCILLHQAVAHGIAPARPGRCCHAAADEDAVDLAQQRFDDADLVGNLGPAQDGNEGAAGFSSALPRYSSSFSMRKPGHRRQMGGHARGAGVGAMRCRTRR